MVRVTEPGSHHTNAYTFEVTDLPNGGVRVVRNPRGIGLVLGRAFQVVGAVLLLATPFAVAQDGLAGAVACGLGAAIGFTIGPALRNLRQILEVDARRRTVDSAWWFGSTRVGWNAHHLKAGRDANLTVKRVRALKSTAGPPIYMFAVGVAARRGARPVTVLHTDRPEQAEDLTRRMERALGLAEPGAAESVDEPVTEPVG